MGCRIQRALFHACVVHGGQLWRFHADVPLPASVQVTRETVVESWLMMREMSVFDSAAVKFSTAAYRRV